MLHPGSRQAEQASGLAGMRGDNPVFAMRRFQRQQVQGIGIHHQGQRSLQHLREQLP